MFGIYVRFEEGHGRWMRKGIPSGQIADSWAEQESEHWSVSTTLEVWEKPDLSPVYDRKIKEYKGKLPRIPHPDE